MKSKILIGSAIVALVCAAIFYFSRDRFPGPLRVDGDISATGTETIASNLNSPWSIAFFGDTALISSRNTGELLELLPGGQTRTILTVEDSVHRGEGGLLGLAAYDNNYLYAYYTTSVDNRVVRYKIEGEAGNLSLEDEEVILSGLPAASVHNGGRIAFGPDGLLYITVGDAGNPSSAQDLDSLGGKILRINPNGDIPSDNPFEGSPVYSYGHRNPQGIAWGEDGTMYATEFGQNTWDELNVIRPRGNYGWPEVEGGDECPWNADCMYTGPVQKWATKDASPSGIAYASENLYIANLRGAVLRVVGTDDLKSEATYFKNELGRIRDATIAPDGRLWVVTNNTDGRGNPREGDDRIISIELESLK